MLDIIQLPALEDNYIYLLHEPNTGETAVIDPAIAEPVLAILRDKQWSLKYILNTHHHQDHIGANINLQEITNCTIAGSLYDQHRIPGISMTLTEDGHLMLGDISISILELPGHTLGHIAFYIPVMNALFCGDTLFAMGCGRLFEGTPEQLWRSLQKLKNLPKSTLIYCAHEYTQANGRFALQVEPNNSHLHARMLEVNELRKQNFPTIPSLLSDELATNPFLREGSSNLQNTLNLQGKSALEIFTTLRRLKDNF